MSSHSLLVIGVLFRLCESLLMPGRAFDQNYLRPPKITVFT